MSVCSFLPPEKNQDSSWNGIMSCLQWEKRPRICLDNRNKSIQEYLIWLKAMILARMVLSCDNTMSNTSKLANRSSLTSTSGNLCRKYQNTENTLDNDSQSCTSSLQDFNPPAVTLLQLLVKERILGKRFLLLKIFCAKDVKQRKKPKYERIAAD